MTPRLVCTFVAVMLFGIAAGLTIQEKKTLCHQLITGRDPIYHLGMELNKQAKCDKPVMGFDLFCLYYRSMLTAPSTYGRTRMMRAIDCVDHPDIVPKNVLAQCEELELLAGRTQHNIQNLFIRERKGREIFIKYSYLYTDYVKNFTDAIGCAGRSKQETLLFDRKQDVCNQISKGRNNLKMKEIPVFMKNQCSELLGDETCLEYMNLLQNEGSDRLLMAANIIQCNKEDGERDLAPEEVCRRIREVPAEIPNSLAKFFPGQLKKILNQYTFLFSMFIERTALELGCPGKRNQMHFSVKTELF